MQYVSNGVRQGRQQPAKIRILLQQKFQTLSKLRIGQMVYFYSAALARLHTESNSDTYYKLLSTAYGPFQNLQVSEHTLTVKETRITNIISVDCATQFWRRLNMHGALERQ